jgi:hypothetical protein
MARRAEGQGPELLDAALKRTSTPKMRLEQEMNVASGLVYRWISRERTPGLLEAEYLERRFGIPTIEWLTAEQIRDLGRVRPDAA